MVCVCVCVCVSECVCVFVRVSVTQYDNPDMFSSTINWFLSGASFVVWFRCFLSFPSGDVHSARFKC